MKAATLIRAIIGFALYLLATPALLFISAGTVRWPMAWIYVGAMMVAAIGSRLIVWRRSPDTLVERARFTSAEGTQAWDRILVPLVAILGPWVMMVVAGLDRRFGWSRNLDARVQLVAVLLLLVGYGLAVWAMVVNRYFSAVARIQEDRGQQVVRDGPYRFVRHPSYLGGALGYLALPIMLEALWSLLPAALVCVALVIRTKLEDEMLLGGLEGYETYAATTRYRLLPGIW